MAAPNNYGAALDFIVKEFGGTVEETDETVSVGTTVTDIVGNDPDAVALVLINLGATTVFVAPTNTVATNKGIQLNANGGFMSLIVRDDLILPANAWYGIADTAASDVYVIRIRRLKTIKALS